jgi:hypothetical protein
MRRAEQQQQQQEQEQHTSTKWRRRRAVKSRASRWRKREKSCVATEIRNEIASEKERERTTRGWGGQAIDREEEKKNKRVSHLVAVNEVRDVGHGHAQGLERRRQVALRRRRERSHRRKGLQKVAVHSRHL